MLYCRLPLGNDTLKDVLLATAASMTACKSQLTWWWWYSQNSDPNAVYPESVSIQRLYYAIYDDDNSTLSNGQVRPINESSSYAPCSV